MTRVNPFLHRQFVATVRKVRDERSAAAATVSKLLRKTPRRQWPGLADHPSFTTFGAVELLGQLIAQDLDRDAPRALQLARLAVTIADNLPQMYPEVLRTQARAYAYKDLGKAFRVLARIDESVFALKYAERLLLYSIASEYDLAVVRFNLAMSLQEADRFGESLKLLQECKRVFSDHGDTSNALNCGIGEAVLLLRLKRPSEAHVVAERLLNEADDAPLPTQAAIHHTLGFASIDVFKFDAAALHLRRAMEMHRRLDMPLHALRSQVGIGRLMIRKGELEDAIELFETLRREFAQQELLEEAGLCRLEIVDALLRKNERDIAEVTAYELAREFTLAGFNARAVDALNYLGQAIEAQKATTAVIYDIHDYIVSLRTNPERELRLPRLTA